MRSSILFVLLLFVPLQLSAQSAPTISQSSAAQKLPSVLQLSRTLQKGMSGPDVSALQRRLSAIPGIYSGEATGYFGGATEQAVQLFQRRFALVESGSPQTTGYGAVGHRTLQKINDLAMGAIIPVSSRDNSALSSSSATHSSSSTNGTTALSTSTASSTTTSVGSGTSTVAKATAPLPAKDTTPPVRSQGSPAGVLPYTTKTVKIALITNEQAWCYWSNIPHTPFEYMTQPFTTTGWMTHSSQIQTANPGDYAFYVKCRDKDLNINSADYPILFSIEHPNSGGDRETPRVAMSFPTGAEVLTEGFITLFAVAADNTEVAGVRFYLSDEDLDVYDSQAPYALTVHLSPGAYTTFATVSDGAGNHATSSRVAFTVVAKSPPATAALSPRTVASPLEAFLSVLERWWETQRMFSP